MNKKIKFQYILVAAGRKLKGGMYNSQNIHVYKKKKGWFG